MDILLLIVVAGFILFRLLSVLGQRPDDEERGARDPFGFGRANRDQDDFGEDGEDNVIDLSSAGHERPDHQPSLDMVDYIVEGSDTAEGIGRIQTADRSFNIAEFLDGARDAYEMIVAAFAAGDTKALASLLADDVYGDFEQEVNNRANAGETAQSSIVGIHEARAAEADMKGNMAEVTVRFVTDMVAWVKNKNGEVIDGHETATRRVTDVWTFARDTRSSDPNWKLVATGEG